MFFVKEKLYLSNKIKQHLVQNIIIQPYFLSVLGIFGILFLLILRVDSNVITSYTISILILIIASIKWNENKVFEKLKNIIKFQFYNNISELLQHIYIYYIFLKNLKNFFRKLILHQIYILILNYIIPKIQMKKLLLTIYKHQSVITMN